MPRKTGDVETTPSQAEKAKYDQELARYVGVRIARVFFTHERDSLREQVRPMDP
jgi:hypothetical protein